MAKALIDPHTGHRWVEQRGRRRWYVRKLYKHGGTLNLRIPQELTEELHLDTDSYVMLKREPAGLVFSVLDMAKSKEEKEAR